MAAKLGFEAIEYILKKALTKKGVKGIPTIPGPAYKMRMQQLVDAMADKMRKIGYDINKVTEKQVQGLLDYADAMEKQKIKAEALKRFPKETHKFFGRPLKEADFKEIDKLYPPKKDPFMGFTPRIVSEEVTASPDRIRKGFSTQMKLNRPEENQALIKSFMKRENAEFNSLNREQKKEIFDMFDAHMRPKKPDLASGGLVDLLKL